MTFNYSMSDFRLCFFHRDGLLVSTATNLSDRGGLETFVAAITGMWNWKTSEAAGYHPSQSHPHFSFNGDLYQVNDVLCRRYGIRVRATRVFVLKKEYTGATSEEPPPALKSVKSIRKPLEPLLLPQSRSPEGTTRLRVVTLPDLMVVKCSFPLAIRELEASVFQPVRQYIGSIETLDGYNAECVRPPKDVKHRNVFGLRDLP